MILMINGPFGVGKTSAAVRLAKRGDAPGSWAFRQTERCLKAYAENPALFETILPTDGLSEDEVCGRILEGIRQ